MRLIDVQIAEYRTREQMTRELDQAKHKYSTTRRSIALPANQGVRKGTKLRAWSAHRLGKARREFWNAWFWLPENQDRRFGRQGQGWTKWMQRHEQAQGYPADRRHDAAAAQVPAPECQAVSV